MKKPDKFIEKEWGVNRETILVHNPTFEDDKNNPYQKKWRKKKRLIKKKK